MTTTPAPATTGPWKEGRAGGASLCYVLPTLEQSVWIDAHHARVGIRATVVARGDEPQLAEWARRKWDLALGADASAAPHLHTLDQRSDRGYVLTDGARIPPTAPPAAYVVDACIGSIAHPGASGPLPTLSAEPDVTAMQDSIETVVATAGWAIWRITPDHLDAWGSAGHRRLLSWLGDHHARIWCAPVRDIAAFRP